MAKALYTLKDGEIMARRASYMHVSRDGGETFTRYESAGAFEKQTGQRHASADQLAREFIEAPEEPAANIYRKSWPEVVEAMKVERAQPCGTKPTARVPGLDDWPGSKSPIARP